MLALLRMGQMTAASKGLARQLPIWARAVLPLYFHVNSKTTVVRTEYVRREFFFRSRDC